MNRLNPLRAIAPWLLLVAATFPLHAAEGDLRVLSRADTLRGPKEVTLEVRVAMPAGRTIADALVIVNSSSGREDVVMASLAAAANGAGLAAVVLDTYTPRGIGDTVTNQEKVSYVEQFGDIFAVLQAMRADPRFAGRKIALSGHSRGGILAYMAAFRDFQPFYDAPAPLFDAYIGLSTDCLPTFKTPALHGPLHLVSGGQDNWTKPEPCMRQVARLKAAQQPASMDVIPGVNHSFSSNGFHVASAIKFACPADRDYFYVQRERTDQPMKILDSEKEVAETPRELWRRCAGTFGMNGRGANAGGDRDKMPQAVHSTIQFLQSLGWQ